jgi:alanine dehydrogenase
MEENEALRKGLNLIDGKVVCPAVAESLGFTPLEGL